MFLARAILLRMDEPVARSLDELASPSGISAVFCAGASPLGHRWEIRGTDNVVLARTARVHSGGKAAQRFWKLVTLTGMDVGNDIHVEVRGAGGMLLARISSINEKPALVTVSDPDQRQIAKTVRKKDEVSVFGSDDSVLAQLVCDGDGPWPVLDDAAVVLGQLVGGEPGPSLRPELLESLLFPREAINSAAYKQSQHLGLRRVTRYTLLPVTGTTLASPLALLPLMAGLTY
ncbi:hypothetical protein LAUMK136_04965 [Mycobacterium attenuatum]|uniref:Uncharacterized protein n=2 Tax=Mycobacterium attenuatum TaxID=2341086 RepID=A0A498QCA1_9MYCO|nr:hypothetical protein LAUMK136_04965 [Mycobacterium attenuatum]